MVEMSALILAAGRGVRMESAGRLMPKGLLKIGDEPLVVRSVKLLRQRGIKDIRIVTGHLCDQYEALFGGQDDVELIHNPVYETTGSLLSLMTGLQRLDGPVVLLESDIVYEARALAPVAFDRTRIILSGQTSASDEVYIWVRNGEKGTAVFNTMSKDIHAHAGDHFGELVGITCFSKIQVENLKNAAEVVLARDPKSDYESSIIELAKKTDIEAILIKDLAWTEIDDEKMYARAVSRIWPLIQKSENFIPDNLFGT